MRRLKRTLAERLLSRRTIGLVPRGRTRSSPGGMTIMFHEYKDALQKPIKDVFSQCMRTAAVVAMLCMYLMPSGASAANLGWQGLVDEHAALMKQGQHERALEVAHKALAMAEANPDRSQQNIASSLLALGATYQGLEQPGKALPHFQRMHAIVEKALGPDHPDTAMSLSSLASTYSSLEQYEVALPLQQRVLAIREKYSGPDHSDVAMSLNNLAEAYVNLSRYGEALPLQHRALTILEKTFGAEHPDTAVVLNNLASTYIHLGQYDKAQQLLRRVLTILERERGIEHPDFVRILSNLGFTYAQLAQYDQALSLHQRALTIREKTVGPEHPDTASSLINVAAVYVALARHEQALPLQQRALTIREATLGKEHRDTAMSLGNVAGTYVILDQHEKALPLQQRALTILEKVLGPEHLDTALSLNNLAGTYGYLAQHDKALPLEQRALAIREKTLGAEHPDTAGSLNNLAATYSHLAQYDKALPLQQRAVAIREKALGFEHPDLAVSLDNLAHIYGKLARYDMALSLQHRALVIREKALGPEHPYTALSLHNLADTYIDLAKYDEALSLQQRALHINEKTLGPDHTQTAHSLASLAATYSALAQHAKALPLKRRALAIREKALGPEHPDTASSLNNLAETYVDLAQFDESLPLHQRASAIIEKNRGPEHPDTAVSLSNLAVVYGKLGRYEEALQLQQRALFISERALGPVHTRTATSLGNLAETYVDLAQYDKALPLQQRALAINEQILGHDHPRTATSLNNLAFTFKDMGLPNLAISFFKLAVNARQNQRERIGRIDAASLLSYTESVTYTYQALASLLVDQGLLPDAQLVLDMLKEVEQFEFIRRSPSADARTTRIGYNGAEKTWMDRYRQIAGRLVALGVEEQALNKQTRLGLSPEQKQRQQTLAADLRVAQTAFESFLKAMQESFARQGPAKAAEVTETRPEALRELQALLRGIGQDAVLLQYYVTNDKVGMLLTTPGVQLARSTNVTAKDLNRQIAEFRRMLRDPKSDLLKASLALYQLLVAPVAQDLEQAAAKTVMLSLDGALRYLPFGALHDGERYLVQRWNLPMYTSVVRNRLREAASPRWQAAGLGVTRALGEFAALPAVKTEMRSIIQTDGRGGLLPGEVHLDEAFTAQRFKDVSQRSFQLLHVASHFRFSPGTEVNSFLLLGDGEQLSLGDLRTQNYRFDNVDLLTLSACDTGLGGGRDAQGREIEGFGVIAQQQGAKAVLATLWPVADESTADLMVEMYRRRQDQRLSKIEALRQAQMSLLAQSRYAHPFYWAPFILMGNWR